jgi:hypothetical protein
MHNKGIERDAGIATFLFQFCRLWPAPLMPDVLPRSARENAAKKNSGTVLKALFSRMGQKIKQTSMANKINKKKGNPYQIAQADQECSFLTLCLHDGILKT